MERPHNELVRLSKELFEKAEALRRVTTGLDYFICQKDASRTVEAIEQYLFEHPGIAFSDKNRRLLSPHQNYKKYPESLKNAAFLLQQAVKQKTENDEAKKNTLPSNFDIIIDGSTRYIFITGQDSHFVKGLEQWDFIKDLIASTGADEFLRVTEERKNCVDSLRNSLKNHYGEKLGKAIHKRIIISSKRDGYRIGGDVKTVNFAQVAIRPIKQATAAEFYSEGCYSNKERQDGD